MLLTLRFLILFLVLSSAIQANTFGKDTRQLWKGERSSMPNPLDRVGTLRHPYGERCTASYIGKGLVLTAAHCVMKHGKNQLQKGDYLFEYIHKQYGGYEEFRAITRFHYIELVQLEDAGIESAKSHWVILELSSPILFPDRFFGFHYPGDNEYDEHHESNYDLSIIGFSPEFNGNTQALTFSNAHCNIQEHLFNSYVALHNCDAGPRDSGSPLYKCQVSKDRTREECTISAIHVGAFSQQGTQFEIYTRANANVAVTVKSFRETLYYLLGEGLRPYNLKTVNNYYSLDELDK